MVRAVYFEHRLVVAAMSLPGEWRSYRSVQQFNLNNGKIDMTAPNPAGRYLVLYDVVKRTMFLLPPEKIHTFVFGMIKTLHLVPVLGRLARPIFSYNDEVPTCRIEDCHVYLAIVWVKLLNRPVGTTFSGRDTAADTELCSKYTARTTRSKCGDHELGTDN